MHCLWWISKKKTLPWPNLDNTFILSANTQNYRVDFNVISPTLEGATPVHVKLGTYATLECSYTKLDFDAPIIPDIPDIYVSKVSIKHQAVDPWVFVVSNLFAKIRTSSKMASMEELLWIWKPTWILFKSSSDGYKVINFVGTGKQLRNPVCKALL